jgi:hypothetical protein
MFLSRKISAALSSAQLSRAIGKKMSITLTGRAPRLRLARAAGPGPGPAGGASLGRASRQTCRPHARDAEILKHMYLGLFIVGFWLPMLNCARLAPQLARAASPKTHSPAA